MEKVVVRRHTFNGMKEEIIKIGSSCFIGHCGSGHSVFGENGTVTKIKGNYIYCTSESGSVIKWNIEKRDVCGKWKTEFYFVQFNITREYCTPEHITETIKSRPSIWNSKKCTLEYK